MKEGAYEVQIKEEHKITDYEAIPLLFHEKKSAIIKVLMEKELNLKELSEELKLNPGTVHRHLKDLLRFELITETHEEKKYGQKMIYYRANATRQYLVSVNFKWPDEE